MQCYTHSDRAAAGICKACGKGVCRQCAIPVTRGLACSEECKPVVQALSRLQSASIRNLGMLSGQRLIQPLIAAIFLGSGIYLLLTEGNDFFTWFMLATGIVLTLAIILTWSRRSKETS